MADDEPPLREHDMNLIDLVGEQYRRASCVIGLTPPPLIVDDTIRNATSDGWTVRWNPRWLGAVVEQLALCCWCSRALARGIMAHELGHHHDARPSPVGWDREKFADVVAGMVLACSGASPEPYTRLLAIMPASPNHPSTVARQSIVRIGHRAGLDGGEDRLRRMVAAGSSTLAEAPS